MFKRKETGEIGEKAALKYLKKQGFKVLEKNYRALRGEIDIIAREENTLVFVEVKTNSASNAVPPELRVNIAKQKQIGKIASAFIREYELYDIDCRFDVVGITLSEDGSPEISHIRDAFWLARDV